MTSPESVYLKLNTSGDCKVCPSCNEPKKCKYMIIGKEDSVYYNKSYYRELFNCIGVSSDFFLLFKKKKLFFFHNEINCGFCWIKRFPPDQFNTHFTDRIIQKGLNSYNSKINNELINYNNHYKTLESSYINKSFPYGDFIGLHKSGFNLGKIEYNSVFNEKITKYGFPTIRSYIGSMHPQYFYPSPCPEFRKYLYIIENLLNINSEEFVYKPADSFEEYDIYNLGIGTLIQSNNDIIRGGFLRINNNQYDTKYKCIWGVMENSNNTKFFISPDNDIIPFDHKNNKHIYIDTVSKLYTRFGLNSVDLYQQIFQLKMNRQLELQKSASSREVADLKHRHDCEVKNLKNDINNVRKNLRIAENRLRTQRFNMSQEAGGSGAGKQDVFECGICRDVLKNGEDVVVALQNCGHIYHKICIQNWQKRQNTCPFCKQRINGLLQIFL